MQHNASIIVNGQRHSMQGTSARNLLSVLRDDFGLTGTRYGCGEGLCGACTVLVDGAPVQSCTFPAADAVDRSVTTIEGLAQEGELHPVQRAFLEAGAMQCGFCTSGMVMAAAALIATNRNPDVAAITAGMDGNVCRCCTYPRIVAAVRRGAELAAGQSSLDAGDSAGAASAWSSPGVVAAGPVAATSAWSSPASAGRAPWDLQDPAARDYFAVLGDGLVAVLPPPAAQGGRGRPPAAWSTSGGAWIHIGADGLATAFTGKVDVGQDNRTALAMLVAEELRLPLESVRVVMGDTDVCPYDMGTFGSRSTPDAGETLRGAAAAARQKLLDLAAERWEIAAADLDASDGAVQSRDRARSASYGEIVAGGRHLVTASGPSSLTPSAAWRTAGRATPRMDAADAVTGARRYGSDLTLAGMLVGKVLRPPAFGATLRSVDLSAAEALPGVTVVHEGDFVGVAAPDRAAADRALAAIDAQWDLAPQPSEAELEEHLRSHPAEEEGWGGSFDLETGDVDGAIAKAPVKLAATYTAAYIAHVPLETRAALADWADGRLTVWTGTQRPFPVREEVAEALGVPELSVRVVVPPTGGAYGGKHSSDVAIEAARLARAAGRPVRVRWTRAEEFSWAYFRPAAVIDVRSAALADGAMAAWEFTNINAGSPAIITPYRVPNQRITYQPAESPLRQGSYRALGATVNHFARESHMDELAAALGADPLEFRLRNLDDDRLAAVFRAAAERAGWTGRPLGDGRGMGIAGGAEKDSRIATVAEVRVDGDGRPSIVRLVAAFECGAIVNPDNLVNQVEGALIMGLGGALFEAVHFADGRILNGTLTGYRVPRFADVPPIEVVLLDRKDLPSAGAGETPLVVVAPAIANAIFAASGVRLRAMPLLPDGVIPS